MRSGYFYAIITGDFERLHYFNFEARCSGKRKRFPRNWSLVFLLEITTIQNTTL